MFDVESFTKSWQFVEVVFRVFPWYSVDKMELYFDIFQCNTFLMCFLKNMWRRFFYGKVQLKVDKS
jgi:hypothetical protein